MFWAFKAFDRETESLEVDKKRGSLEGRWKVIREMREVHFDEKIPEPDLENVDYWDPEKEWGLVGREVEWYFIIDENNLLITEEALETDVILDDNNIYFETEWFYSRSIKWAGEIQENYEKINGSWEMWHPVHGIMSSGDWAAKKL